MSQIDWQDLSSVPQSDRSKLIRLASYGAVSIRAIRLFGTDYDPQALAEKEASLERKRLAEEQALRSREKNGEQVIWPLGTPATYGEKPWLADVPLRRGMEQFAPLPSNILAMMDDDAWDTNIFEFIDERDNRRRWLMEGLQFCETYADGRCPDEPKTDEQIQQDDALPDTRWTEKRMIEEIKACEISDRDDAWENIFKPIRHIHGWDNTAFRSVWPVARGTKGRPGRPKKSAHNSG